MIRVCHETFLIVYTLTALSNLILFFSSSNSDSSVDFSSLADSSRSSLGHTDYNTASSNSSTGNRYNLRASSVSSFASTQSESPDIAALRDLTRRGRRSTTRSTGASSSSASSHRSRSPHSSLASNLDQSSDSSPTPMPTRRYPRRSNRSDTASVSSANSERNQSARTRAQISRRQAAADSESSFTTAPEESDSSNLAANSPQVEDSDSDTEIYAVPLPPDDMNIEGEVAAGNDAVPVDDDDDDVLFIPPNIPFVDLCTTQVQPRTPRQPQQSRQQVTIDLCTQANVRPPVQLDNSDVIFVTDSPIANVQRPPPRRDRAAPYQVSPTYAARAPNQADLLNVSTQMATVAVKCPICFDAATAKEPVSTVCGHIFCRTCLEQALRTSKKCSVCNKAIRSARDYHRLFFV